MAQVTFKSAHVVMKVTLYDADKGCEPAVALAPA